MGEKKGRQKDDLAQAFDRFWAAYPRKAAKAAAKKAFDSAIKGGVAVEMLIDGAGRYAIERAGEEPRYTKHPATWLRGECWDDEPARMNGGPPMIDGATGEVVPAAPRRRRTEDMTWEEIAERAVARLNGGSDEFH